MNKRFTDFYEAWWYLQESPVFMLPEDISRGLEISWFNQSLQIEVQKVCPVKRRIMKDKKRNTHIEVWLECGEPFYDKDLKQINTYHNWHYDCGGDTFEEAIINLANIVYETNREVIDETAV